MEIPQHFTQKFSSLECFFLHSSVFFKGQLEVRMISLVTVRQSLLTVRHSSASSRCVTSHIFEKPWLCAWMRVCALRNVRDALHPMLCARVKDFKKKFSSIKTIETHVCKLEEKK